MVEKMKLVRVQGTMPQLNEFIGSCCMDGRFDLEPATRYKYYEPAKARISKK